MCKITKNGELASIEQRKAANPTQSILLKASAGSGKTKVLIDRMVRLLLNGAELKSIVSLTFTKKAATEIQERLLKRFREYVIADEGKLRKELEKMTGENPSSQDCFRARMLYEEMLDDQAGLQIGTIHSWCQGLLTRFADVANVDPSFVVIEDSDELWDEALTKLEQELSGNKTALNELAIIGNKPKSIRDKLKKVLDNRVKIDRWSDRVADKHGITVPLENRTDLFEKLTEDLQDEIYGKDGVRNRSEVYAFAKNSVKQILDDLHSIQDIDGDKATASMKNKLSEIRMGLEKVDAIDCSSPEVLSQIKESILTKTGTLKIINGTVGTKPEKNDLYKSICKNCLLAFALDEIITIVENNIIQLKYGLRTVDIYDSIKARDRVLDFHDLERKTRELFLGNFDVSQWIQYRTDCGIKHILIDEFQDTNRVQWDIIKPFMDNIICTEDNRTLFLVGDVKQSIYRFRGACPEIFGEVADEYKKVAEELNLPTNFRTTKLLVENVGLLFQKETLSGLLPDGEFENVKQLPYRNDTPGEIVYHEIANDGKDVSDRREAIASHTATIVKNILDDQKYTPGDILILSRNRTAIKFYEEALRKINVPFVPSGRGALADTCEVNDILNLLRWLIYRDDNSALAGVLRSPIFRFSQAELQKLLTFRQQSGGTLWKELSIHKNSWPECFAQLNSWLDYSGKLSSHSLLRNFFQGDLLDRFEAALGEQARYNLLRLYDLALEHDAGKFPTTRGFIKKIEQSALRKNHDEGTLPDTDKGRLQILTIHGAKGLEAPVVLYVDAASHIRDDESEAHLIIQNSKYKDSGPLLTGVKKIHREPVGNVETNLSTVVKSAQYRNEKEEANLLYVAITRARDVLHVLGSKPKNKESISHLNWIAETEILEPWETLDLVEECSIKDFTSSDMPSLWTAPNTEVARVEVSNPSTTDKTDDKKIADKENENRVECGKTSAIRGTRIHLLLELATQSGCSPSGDDSESLEASKVFNNPKFKWIFNAENGFNEIPFMHNKDNKLVYGIIDRMIVENEIVHIIDYKSNQVDKNNIDSKTDYYLPQMEAYKSAVQKIYPERNIKTYLLFTAMDDGELVEIT
jgi:ATP-dependent helicase/nuclease subunit A